MRTALFIASALSLVVAACQPPAAEPNAPPPAAPAPPPPAVVATPTAPVPVGADRDAWNQAALHANLPIYWARDKNGNGAADRDEVVSLLFYPNVPIDDALAQMKRGDAKPTKPASAADAERLRLVEEDLDQGKVTLVETNATPLSADDKTIVRHVLTLAKLIDDLYAAQTGMAALASKVPADDAPSQSLFRRDWGPRCVAPKTEKLPACSAIPGSPKQIVDVYPAELQNNPKFCESLEKLPNAKKLLSPFVVVRQKGGGFEAVSYAEAYRPHVDKIAAELRATAAAIQSPTEAALKAYLDAAAKSFTTNDWRPADEAWAKMNAQNSKFYLRIGPDETYWEPCSQKAGFHLTFALLNKASLAWQKKLTPVQGDMERALADLIGPPYAARKVTFHLPDFIDIVFNAGDDRQAIGATIGQSLPNWGPVANEGRGRTVAMSNLYTDVDSMKLRRAQAESLLVKQTMAIYDDDPTSGLVATILHEATHNLGPAHEYAYRGKKDVQAFGGQLASMLEELKAQTGALYYVDFARKRGIISADLARRIYVDNIVWAFGHISRGMVTATGERQPYSQLAAIQVGFLMDHGAIRFDPQAQAANGADEGAFMIDVDKMPGAVEKLMKTVATIKATNDRAGAEALSAKYVDGPTVPQRVITERELRFPKASFVYALEL